jgi:protein-L-isoaspartate(D-aspartate) O-methyltransferase
MSWSTRCSSARAAPAVPHTDEDLEPIRRAYAERLRVAARLRSNALVDALARVPRERFLGPGPWQVVDPGMPTGPRYSTTPDANPKHVYADVLIAIDASRGLNNGQPSGLASWIDSLELKAGERVIHIGCGTGYYTAILAEIVGPTGFVIGIDIDVQLAHRARQSLAGYNHVEVWYGDDVPFEPGNANAVFVNAGATHPLPEWLDVLALGGRLLIPLTATGAEGYGTGGMFLLSRTRAGFAARCISGVAIYPCIGVRDPDLGLELGRRRGTERQVHSFRRDAHEPDTTCWLHTPAGCFSMLYLGTGA